MSGSLPEGEVELRPRAAWMIRRLVRRRASTMLFAVSCLGQALEAQASQPGSAFLHWAQRTAISLPALATPYRPGSLASLGSAIGSSRVVALGEFTHGAHEPLELRNRLARYLVEVRGFTAIALESGLSESMALNAYVHGAPGNLDSLVRANMTWGFGNFAENRQLVAWLRAYNLNTSHPRKVSFYGIDLTGGDGDVEDFVTSRRALDEALAYLAGVDSASASTAIARLRPFLPRLSRRSYDSIPSGERDLLTATIADLVNTFESQSQRLTERSSRDEYEWGRQNAVMARQLDGFLRHETSAFTAALNLRDYAMAENVRWVLDRAGPAGRVFVFAHNGHVMNHSLHPPGTTELWTTMGQHLRTSLGRELFTIATTAHRVELKEPVADDSTSVDAILASLGRPMFFLDLRGAKRRPSIVRWLGQPRAFRMNSKFEDVVLGESTDAIVFFSGVTPANSSKTH